MKLSPHFTLAEYLVSETAARLGIDNAPRDPSVMQNLRRMAAVMEQIRELMGCAIIVTSGYRGIELNSAIGSKPTSAHVAGLATDFIAPGHGSPYAVCKTIEPHVRRLGIDQLIYEHTWIHVGLRTGEARHQVMTLAPGGRYVAGIVLKGSVAA